MLGRSGKTRTFAHHWRQGSVVSLWKTEKHKLFEPDARVTPLQNQTLPKPLQAASTKWAQKNSKSATKHPWESLSLAQLSNVFSLALVSEPILGRGCDEAPFSEKKGIFSEKRGGNSVNEVREPNQQRRFVMKFFNKKFWMSCWRPCYECRVLAPTLGLLHRIPNPVYTDMTWNMALHAWPSHSDSSYKDSEAPRSN